MSVHNLAKLRPAKPLQLPESWTRVSELFGFPQPKTWTAFELWGRGRSTYVMLVGDNRLRVNVSLTRDFASRAEARAWAVAFCAGLGRDIPEQPKRGRLSRRYPKAGTTERQPEPREEPLSKDTQP